MNSLRDVEIRWAVLKKIKIAYVGDEIVEHYAGDFLREEASSWSSQTLDQLRESGKIAPVTIPSDEWLLGEAARRGLVDGGDSGRGAVVPANASEEPAADSGSAPAPAEEVAGHSDDSSFPRHLGGSRFELSDGAVIQGKRAADAAQRALDTMVEA